MIYFYFLFTTVLLFVAGLFLGYAVAKLDSAQIDLARRSLDKNV
jgi:hypothetical protein